MTTTPQRVLVAMSGGVDSSVAAAMLVEDGHEVAGVTLKLWGGDSDTGCCSVSDVDDARRAADALGIDHHVFNFTDEFNQHVVDPYVAAHAAGRTPNPCVECNRHLKFDRLLRRADALGFDAVATGHHARIVVRPDGSLRVARGADGAKDQSYVIHMLSQQDLARVLLPIGGIDKAEVRRRASALNLVTASKPDSQDVCFITSEAGRARFLGDRIGLTPGQVVDQAGTPLGRVDAVELVTVGQRKGLGGTGGGPPLYALGSDPVTATVTVGTRDQLQTAAQAATDLFWATGKAPTQLVAGGLAAAVQCSAHGHPQAAVLTTDPTRSDQVQVTWDQPQRRIAPGQSIVFYEGDQVLGAAIAT